MPKTEQQEPQTTAEKLTAGVGSWKFINYQTVAIVAWIFFNSFLCFWIGIKPVDPFPYVLLNLFFSTQAAYASPIILMAQVAQAKRDQRKDDRMREMTEHINRQTDALVVVANTSAAHEERTSQAMVLQTETIRRQSETIQTMAGLIESLPDAIRDIVREELNRRDADETT